MLLGFLSEEKWEVENESLHWVWGASAEVNFLSVSKKRDDASNPEYREFYWLSYQEMENFLFSFLEWLILSSYRHSSWRQMAQTGWGWIMRQAWKEEHKGVISGPEEPTPGMMDGSAHELYLLLPFRLFPCSSVGPWIRFPLWKSPSSLLLSP